MAFICSESHHCPWAVKSRHGGQACARSVEQTLFMLLPKYYQQVHTNHIVTCFVCTLDTQSQTWLHLLLDTVAYCAGLNLATVQIEGSCLVMGQSMTSQPIHRSQTTCGVCPVSLLLCLIAHDWLPLPLEGLIPTLLETVVMKFWHGACRHVLSCEIVSFQEKYLPGGTTNSTALETLKYHHMLASV